MHHQPSPQQLLLLQASLFSGDKALKAWEMWSQDIDFDTIDPASYKLLPLVSRNPALQMLKDPLFEKCKGIYQQVWVTNQLNWHKMRSFLCQMPGVNKIVLLKGIAMILHYYNDFGVRILGDIDIFLERAEAISLTPFLRKEGWKAAPFSRFDITNRDHLNRWHALNFTHASGLHLDLHWSFIEENIHLLDEAVLNEAVPFFPPLYVPSATDLFIQICVHGMKPSKVPLIRWIPDAVILLRQGDIHWERFIELAEKSHLSKLLSLALSYLAKEFEVPIPVTALEKLSRISPLRLESLEYWCHGKNYSPFAAWCRYFLNHQYFTLWDQLIHIPHYVQVTARLKSPWHVPLFVLYWPLKRIIT